MPPFDTFTGGVVNPGNVSYLSLAISVNTALQWPSFSEETDDVVASIIDLSAAGPGLTLSMPDARQAGNGSLALIYNVGAQSVTLNDAAGGNIATIAAGVAKLIYLRDNSTQAGSWGVFTYGTGTSSADASMLAGSGLQAIAGQLAQSGAATVITSATSVVGADLAKTYVATSGTFAFTLPTSASVGPNFFIGLKNNGTGTVTLTPSGGDVVDTAATVALAPNDACIVFSMGNSNAWFTVGLGRSVAFAFTQLVKSVAGAADVTLTSAECANKVHTYTGVLTGSINVIVTNTVSVYYVFNNTTGAFNLTVKTAAGSGITVTQGSHEVLVCDGTNVYKAVTNVSGTTLFSAGSASNPSVSFVSNVTTGLYIPSSGVLGITAGGFEVMSFNSVASAVNWIDAYASATGVAVSLRANGTDPNVGLQLRPKGTGTIQFTDGTDTTKVVAFTMSAITTGTTRTLTVPNESGTIVLDTATQTLTNKTLTNPANTGQTLTDAATVAWDMNGGAVGVLTATGGIGATRQMGTPTNMKIGTFILVWNQDAAGGRALTFNATWKTTSGIPPAFATGPNQVNIISGFCNGVNMFYNLAIFNAA